MPCSASACKSRLMVRRPQVKIRKAEFSTDRNLSEDDIRLLSKYPVKILKWENGAQLKVIIGICFRVRVVEKTEGGSYFEIYSTLVSIIVYSLVLSSGKLVG